MLGSLVIAIVLRGSATVLRLRSRVAPVASTIKFRSLDEGAGNRGRMLGLDLIGENAVAFDVRLYHDFQLHQDKYIPTTLRGHCLFRGGLFVHCSTCELA